MQMSANQIQDSTSNQIAQNDIGRPIGSTTNSFELEGNTKNFNFIKSYQTELFAKEFEQKSLTGSSESRDSLFTDKTQIVKSIQYLPVFEAKQISLNKNSEGINKLMQRTMEILSNCNYKIENYQLGLENSIISQSKILKEVIDKLAQKILDSYRAQIYKIAIEAQSSPIYNAKRRLQAMITEIKRIDQNNLEPSQSFDVYEKQVEFDLKQFQKLTETNFEFGNVKIKIQEFNLDKLAQKVIDNIQIRPKIVERVGQDIKILMLADKEKVESIDQKPISEIITERIKQCNYKYYCNDNISRFIKEGEIDLLINEVTKKVEGTLRSLVIDIDNDHNTHDTARRVAKMYIKQTFHGRYSPVPAITAFPNIGYLSLYTTGPISIRSTCAHHFQNIIGKCWIGVVPENSVIGLSKFNRIVRHISQRPQIQEEMTTQIANELIKYAKTPNIAVVIKAEHHCMTMRGVREHESDMTTTIMRGSFMINASLKQQFYDVCLSMKGHRNN